MLYWAEGSKGRNQVHFANSDVNMVRFFWGFLRVLKSTHLVQHIYGAIQEYAGFDEPRWLDGPPRKPASNGAVAGSAEQ
jgi:hypothetical protein